MTIEEAIGILEDKDCNYYRSPYQERRDAEKLGIEALEAITIYRGDCITKQLFHLPSETKEEI